PTGGGTGLIGMWKAFNELRTLGWLESDTMPRMMVCQSSGCPSIVRAFDKGERFAERIENASTIATGLRVPAALGDFMILDAVRESGGCATAADDAGIAEWTRLVASTEGAVICPETAICIGVLIKLRDSNAIKADDRIVLFNTATAAKYPPLFGTQSTK
ncbi:MAG: pyridoxal-phosphate dependent enzyme, partial [Phycisphaerae bacterium]